MPGLAAGEPAAAALCTHSLPAHPQHACIFPDAVADGGFAQLALGYVLCNIGAHEHAAQKGRGAQGSDAQGRGAWGPETSFQCAHAGRCFMLHGRAPAVPFVEAGECVAFPLLLPTV